jgi:predicted membrane protein
MQSQDKPTTAEPSAHMALLPLIMGVAIMLTICVRPQLLADATGKADHLAATLLFWAMTAGFVRGVGFIPRYLAARWLLSGMACGLGLLLALWRLHPLF